MIREYAGLGVLDVVFLAIGLAWLRVRPSLSAFALAFTVGWAAYGAAVSILLPMGLPFHSWTVALVCAALAALGLALRRPPSVVPARVGGRFGAISIVVIGGYLALLAARSAPGEADTNWDAWAFWLPKARSLYWFHGLDNGPGGFTHFANRDYPPLSPALDATSYAAMGSTSSAPLQLQHWLLLAAFVGAVACLLATRVSPALLWPSLAALVLMPKVGFFAGSSLGDETLGILVALAAVSAALWLLEPTRFHASLLVLFACAATLLKNEGLIYSLSLTLVVAVVALRRGQPRLASAVVLAPILALVPWKIWLAANDLPVGSKYYGPRDLSPGHLASSAGRLPTTVAHLGWYLLSPNRWLLAVPLAVAAAVLIRRTALFVLTASFLLLSLAGLVLIYWIGNVPIGWWLVTSGDRLVMALTMGCAALFPLLAAQAAEAAAAPTASTSSSVSSG